MYDRSFLAAAALSAAIATLAAPALAATAPATPAQPFAQSGKSALHPSRAEIRDFERAPVSLTEAMAKAETASHGKAVAASFALAKGQPFYDVKTYGNHKLWEGRIDAKTGRVIGTPQETQAARLSATQKAQLRQLTRSGSSLRQAVSSAERQKDAKAIDSEAAAENGKLAYHTELVEKGRLEMVSLDPHSGRVLASKTVPAGHATEGSGSSLPPAPTATLPGGESTNKSLGLPPSGHSLERSPPGTR